MLESKQKDDQRQEFYKVRKTFFKITGSLSLKLCSVIVTFYLIIKRSSSIDNLMIYDINISDISKDMTLTLPDRKVRKEDCMLLR